MSPTPVPPMTTDPFQRGPGAKRVSWGSVSASVVVHAVVLATAAFVVNRPLPPNDPITRPIRPLREVVEAILVLDEPILREGEEDEEEEEERVRALPQVEVTPQGVVITRPDFGDSGGAEVTIPPLTGAGRPGATPAQRLQPSLTDERLWAPPSPEFGTLTPAQREELLIAGRLGAWNDSVAAVAAAAAAFRDWTVTDGDGDRWGVADGRLFLGALGSIPVPVTFSGSSDDRAYLREFAEMQRSGQSAVIQQGVRERMEAIRARRDRERAEAQARGDSVGTAPRGG